jgi:hypothetical protein
MNQDGVAVELSDSVLVQGADPYVSKGLSHCSPHQQYQGNSKTLVGEWQENELEPQLDTSLLGEWQLTFTSV